MTPSTSVFLPLILPLFSDLWLLLPTIVSSIHLTFLLLMFYIIVFCLAFSSPLIFLLFCHTRLFYPLLPCSQQQPSVFPFATSPLSLSCTVSISFHHHLIQQCIKNRYYTTLSIITPFNVKKNKITAMWCKHCKLHTDAP